MRPNKNFHRHFHWKFSWKKIDVKNFRNFSISKFFIFIQFSMKIFDENFEDFSISIFFRRPISKCSNFFHNKPFWSRFFQSCVDFQGGHDGRCFRGPTSGWKAVRALRVDESRHFPSVRFFRSVFGVAALPLGLSHRRMHRRVLHFYGCCCFILRS